MPAHSHTSHEGNHSHAHVCADGQGHEHPHPHRPAGHAGPGQGVQEHLHDAGRQADSGEGCGSCCGGTVTIAAHGSEAPPALLADKEFRRLLVALPVALGAELLAILGPGTATWTVVGMIMAVVAIALSGTAVFRSGMKSLLRGQLNINALMMVAVTGAFLIGEWPEAAMVMALYTLAEFIEHRSVARARNAIKGLLDLSPPVAERRGSNGSWESVAAADVRVGDVLRVRPGERIPLDGEVTAGRSAIDQAAITGESMPVEKEAGDAVYAGTVNMHGGLEVRATALVADTVLARIIHSVEEAQSRRAPTQRFIDRFAAVYTPAVFVLAVLVAVGAPVLFGQPWLESIYRALVLLVIACPCALVISTPVTIVSALAAGARRGILVKGGVHLERARSLTVVAMDKTGTLTQGRPRLVEQIYIGADADEARVRRIAMALASRSDHPVSKAIAAGLQSEAAEVEQFGADAGHGVHGLINGERYELASLRKIREMGMDSTDIGCLLHEQQLHGRTASLLAGPGGVLAIFAVADALRPDSARAVAELKQLGVKTVMLTGDNESAAKSVAGQVGIDEVRAGLLPQEKYDVMRQLSEGSGRAAMVGDGINDAPALAAADIGFAMGGAGTHIAMDTADVVIMNDDLRRIPETMRLSRRTHRVLWQNIVFALGIKIIFLLLAVSDQATMWMAVFADMGASLLVVFNGLRLLRRPRSSTPGVAMPQVTTA